MTLTNIFLIGAPKCGTSSLFNQLMLHPQIKGTDPKETYALLPPDHCLAVDRKYEGLAQLQSVNRSATGIKSMPPSVLLEGTTHHFYSDLAATTVAGLGDKARVIVLLRQPAKRIHSSFLYTKQNLARVRRMFSFADYVECMLSEDLNAIRDAVPDPRSSEVLCMDLHYSDYAHHLQRWRAAIGEDKVKVIISEEYFRNPAQFLSETFQWLGWAPIDIPSTQLVQRNPTRPIASTGLHRIAYRLNELFPNVKFMKPAKSLYFQLQRLREDRATEDVTIPLQRLNDALRPSVFELSNLLRRDLSIWDS